MQRIFEKSRSCFLTGENNFFLDKECQSLKDVSTKWKKKTRVCKLGPLTKCPEAQFGHAR
jgi:hypothetical protein